MFFICDTFPDCPNSEDEVACLLHNIPCPDQCTCHLLAISCFKVDMLKLVTNYPFNFSYKAIHIFSSSFLEERAIFNFFENAIILNVSGNELIRICNMASHQDFLVSIDISRNNISRLQKHCFSHLDQLKSIQLHHNIISSIRTLSFFKLPNILHIDLSFNHIQQLPNSLIGGNLKVEKLYFLTVVNNPIIRIGSDFFPYPVAFVKTSDIRVCCVINSGACLSVSRKYQVCLQLIPIRFLKIIFIIIFNVVFILNFLSLINELFGTPSRTKFFYSFIFINLNDMLFVCFLVLMWALDSIAADDFFLANRYWRGSPLCHILFLLFLLYGLSSPLFASAMALAKLLVVILPLKMKAVPQTFIRNRLVLAQGVIFLVTISVYTGIVSNSNIIPSRICTILADHRKEFTILHFVTIFLSLLLVLAMIFIATCYCIIIRQLQERNEDLNNLQENSETKTFIPKVLPMRMLVMSNILCWLPTGVIYIYSVFMTGYPPYLLMFTITLILPINSITHPVFFLVTSQKNTIFAKCCSKKR